MDDWRSWRCNRVFDSLQCYCEPHITFIWMFASASAVSPSVIVTRTVARSHRGFLAMSWKKICQIRKNSAFSFLCLQYWGLGRKFFLQQIRHLKKYFLSTNLSSSFRPLLAKISHQNSPAKWYFLRPLLTYFVKFSSTWQQMVSIAHGVTVHHLTEDHQRCCRHRWEVFK